MADTRVSQNLPENYAHKKRASGDDINHPQEQLRPQMGAPLPDRLPQSLIEWLAPLNRRYLPLNDQRAPWRLDAPRRQVVVRRRLTLREPGLAANIAFLSRIVHG